jgi:mercuric ion binding protein
MFMRKILLLAILFLVPVALLAAETTKTVTLAVDNMSCAACPITVRKALENVPGVTNAKVDFDTRTATVTFEPARTSVETLIRATTAAGYPSKPAR